MNYSDFEFAEYFTKIATLIPDVENEKLIIESQNDDFIKRKGLVYVFIIDEKILKIGHSITSLKERIQSYNCGKTEYRIKGTNSTTNYFILQSILKINETVDVFAYFPKHPEYEILGEKFKNSFPPSKQAEKYILENLEKKPIGCTQK